MLPFFKISPYQLEKYILEPWVKFEHKGLKDPTDRNATKCSRILQTKIR